MPYIVAVRNTDVNTFFKYMVHLRGLGVRILRGAQAVVFLSAAYRDTVLRTYVPAALREEIAAKSVCIPNGIDPFWHRTACPREDYTPPLHVLYAGVIDKNKNTDATLAAVELLRARGQEVLFTCVGEARDAAAVQALRGKDYVLLLDKADKAALQGIYRQNHVFCMPSLHETFGLVYAEAMSQGLPVLYTRGQGFDGQFPEGEVGFSVDPSDPADIADKLLQCLKDYPARSARAAENSARFNWETIAGRYEALYRGEFSCVSR